MRAQKWICSHWCVLLRRDYYLHQGLSETACKNLFGFSTLCKLVALASRAELWCELKWRLSRLSGEVEALQSKLVTKETVSKPVLCAQGVCPTTQVGGCLQFIAVYVTFCNVLYVLHLFHSLTFAFCNSIYECAKECAQLPGGRMSTMHIIAILLNLHQLHFAMT